MRQQCRDGIPGLEFAEIANHMNRDEINGGHMRAVLC